VPIFGPPCIVVRPQHAAYTLKNVANCRTNFTKWFL